MVPLKDLRQKLLATFQVEHRDHVGQIRSLLAMLEHTGKQAAGGELEEAFRRAHSLKGAARAVDLHPVEGLAHRLETLFSRVRQGVLPLDQEVSGVVQQVLDASEDCVAALGENRPTPGFGPALQAIERVLGMEPEPVAAAEKEPRVSVPAFQPLDSMRVSAQNFDGLLQSAGGLLAESHRQNQVTEQVEQLARRIADMEMQAERTRQAAAPSLRWLREQRKFSRVNVFLDSLDQQVRSLSKQAGALQRSQQGTSWRMGRLSQQLQRDVWQARMVPAESLFDGFRKMMRDLARDETKEIEFRASSTNVQADRGVLEALKDPIMHILRNALCHGIEIPRERAAKGKSPVGLVSLRVCSEGQRLTIAIEDDGRGVDLQRVVEVAVREGILSAPEAAGRTPQELSRILFQPGFSTARSVTDLAGRGMGLSVVREAVRRLHGEVDLTTGDGCGAAFHVSVPLSISMQNLLLVTCGGQPFALPIHSIERLHRIQLKNVETVEGRPVVLLDGQPLPLFGMRELLNLEGSQFPSGGIADADGLRVMILRNGSQRAAVAVEAFLRESEAVIQDLGPAGPRDGKISGGIVLEDGTVALVINVMELMEASVHRTLPSVFTPLELAPQPRSILVVDDSMTTRTLEKSILEAHGYRVRVAVDGMEALSQLRTEKADLVVTDVQMPRMDGFALLEAIKKDPGLERIPVIVVTSLERREDQERGLALGADAYVVKRKFDQAELLTAIRQLL